MVFSSGFENDEAFQPFHRQDLFDDFIGRQVAFPAVEAARAKFAAISAADLGGNAERVTVAGVAVKRGVGGDQNAFDERMVVKPPEEFLRGVMCALLADEFQGVEQKILAEFFAQGLGQVGHRIPGCDAMDVKPFEQLRDAINRLFPRFKPGFQFIAGQGFDISQHVRNLNGGRWKTKQRSYPARPYQGYFSR